MSLRVSLPLLALGALALVAGAPAAAGAEILAVSTVPPQPTSRDRVSLVIEGQLPDSCWKAESACPDLKIQAIDGWEDGTVCLLVLVPYEITCDLGLLAAGNHAVEICEDRVSKREPGTTCLVYQFAVAAAEQDVPGRTWGALKATYR